MTVNATGARRRAFRIAALAFTALAPALLAAEAAQAQTETADKAFSVDIPAQTLARSMAALSTQTGVQVVYDDDAPLSVQAPAVKGRMTVEQTLARITAGTGFTYRFTGAGVVTLVRVPVGNGSDGELVTGVVSVEGYQGSPYFGGAGQAAGVNGINGSRDITATEGTESFTSGALTIGSKVPQALKDIPQSISVLSSERMEQQNVTDFTDAMRQLPGITLTQGTTSLETNFGSRGFGISSIQIDGGAPLSTGYGFYPQIDMSIYDHVELLRGAAGQFGSYGDPSGTINLVRKKPLDHAQFSVEAQAGSWQNYRVVADATSPLALDGKLRGRLVMTYQDNHYFYDTAKDNKTLIYGIAELDVTPNTLLTAGVSYTRQDSVPWMNGLPRYWNGESLDLPRSTSLMFPWNSWDFDTTEIFGGLEQKLGEDWTLKLNLTHNRQSSTMKAGYSYGAVSPITQMGPVIGSGALYDYSSKQLSAEATLSGAFELFGQRQEVTFGANRTKADAGNGMTYEPLVYPNPSTPYQPYPGGPVYCVYPGYGTPCPAGSISAVPPIDVFDFDPNDPLYAEPRDPLAYTRDLERGRTETGAYVHLRLTAFDRLHLTTGLRWSRYEYVSIYENLCTLTFNLCPGLEIGDVSSVSDSHYRADDISWPPPVSLSFDITKSLTAYAGYTDIYQSQANYLGHDRSPVPAVTGSNWEGGLKWAASDGKLNLSLAFYHIRQKGFATIDPPDYSEYEDLGNGVSCCYIADPDNITTSKGIDVEATGEISPGWQVTASYSYNENKTENDGFSGVYASILPKNLYKLWMSYDFGTAGHEGTLSGLTLSGGVNGQSSVYYSGAICKGDFYAPYPSLPSYKVCTIPQEPFDFTVPGHAVFSARIDYRLSDTWSASVNLENIFDKTYYQTVGTSPTGGNWYGAPRSFTATLRAKW